jgi:hypothetical protein
MLDIISNAAAGGGGADCLFHPSSLYLDRPRRCVISNIAAANHVQEN